MYPRRHVWHSIMKKDLKNLSRGAAEEGPWGEGGSNTNILLAFELTYQCLCLRQKTVDSKSEKRRGSIYKTKHLLITSNANTRTGLLTSSLHPHTALSPACQDKSRRTSGHLKIWSVCFLCVKQQMKRFLKRCVICMCYDLCVWHVSNSSPGQHLYTQPREFGGTTYTHSFSNTFTAPCN